MLTRIALVASIMLLAVAGKGVAATEDEASRFVSGLGDRLLSVLRDADLSERALEGELHQLFSKAFDVPAVAKFVMGRHWSTASEAQREEFVGLFRRYVADIYATQFSNYSGETFEIRGQTTLSNEDVLVKLEIIQPDGPGLPVDFRVRRAGEGFKIVDVAVEGLSLIVTKRDEFGSVIARNGVEGLLEALREYNA